MGAQEWTPYYPLITLILTLELGEYMAAQGAEPAMVHRYQSLVLRESSGCLWRLLTDSRTEGRQHLKLGDLCRRYWKYPGLYMLLLREPAKTLVADPLRRLQSAARQRLRRKSAM